MIAALRSLFSLPLLTKELTERAARPRTYWLRIGAALLLYGGFWFNNDETLKRGALDTSSVLGAGEEMFLVTVAFLFICIAAFVPAMLCGVITHEKERDSLVLLLLTRMRPSQIVLQKYLGGLIPALTILFLAMPLVAVAYAYGGVTATDLIAAFVILVLAIFQIGAIALWASCRFRTTVAAFLATYFVGGAVFGLPAFYVEINSEFNLGLISGSHEWLFYAHYPPLVFQESISSYGQSADFAKFTVGSALVAGVALFFLLAAIFQLPRRAFDPPRNRLRRIFAAVDRWVHRVNRRIGSITFGRKSELLPGDLPIVWREKRARALARPEYLIRLLIVVMIPVVLGAVFFVYGGREQDGLSATAGILSALGILSLCTTAANGIVNERVSQTFELLLTTPMSAADILKQKARALRPFLVVLAVPVLTVCGIEVMLEDDWFKSQRVNWIYSVCVILTAVVYLPLFSWFATWIGLWCKTRLRAIVTTLILLIVWMWGPLFIASELRIRPRESEAGRYVLLLSPMFVPILNEKHDLDDLDRDAPWMPVLLNFALYGGILLLIRGHCLKRADWYLRR
jgi:ABC-type Na+ efflux pump permease subunit